MRPICDDIHVNVIWNRVECMALPMQSSMRLVGFSDEQAHDQPVFRSRPREGGSPYRSADQPGSDAASDRLRTSCSMGVSVPVRAGKPMIR